MADAPAVRRPWRGRLTAAVVYVFLAGFALLTLFPFLWMVLTSFQTAGDTFRIPPSLTPSLLFSAHPFANFVELFTRFTFGRYLLNSVFVSTVAAAGQLVTCSLAGFAFARMRLPGRTPPFGALVFTMFVPTEVTIIPEFLLMAKLNWLDTYLPLIVPSLMVGAFGTFLLTETFLFCAQRARGGGHHRRSVAAAHLLARLHAHRPAGAGEPLRHRLHRQLERVAARRSVHLEQRPQDGAVGLVSLQGQYQSEWTLLMAGSLLSILPMILVYLLAQRYIVQGFVTSGLK